LRDAPIPSLGRVPVGQRVRLLPERSDVAPRTADPVVDNDLSNGAEE
jgi:hypothetical protein